MKQTIATSIASRDTMRRVMPVAIPRRFLIALSAFTLLAAMGCQNPFKRDRPALIAPAAAVEMRYYAGTALSGPQATAAIGDDAWRVKANVRAIESASPEGFTRVGSEARLVLDPQAGEVVSPTARLVHSSLIRTLSDTDDLVSSLGEARSVADLQTFEGAIASGVTLSIKATLPDDASTKLTRRAVRVDLSRRAGSYDYDIAISGDERSTDVASALAREVVVLQRTLVEGGDSFAIAVPMSFVKSTAKSIVFEIHVGTEASDEVIGEMKQRTESAAADVAAARAQAMPAVQDVAIARSLAILQSGSPRATLAFVSERTGARIAHAVAMVADERILQVIAGDVTDRLTRLAERDTRSIAWLLDRATIDALSTVKEEDAVAVLPPIQGALSIYAGEAGRQLDVLKSLAQEARSSEDLYNRIVAEHLILLEESSPALRVRAFEWLRAAGAAPAGYDPLASPQDRREALEKSREATTQPAAAGTPN